MRADELPGRLNCGHAERAGVVALSRPLLPWSGHSGPKIPQGVLKLLPPKGTSGTGPKSQVAGSGYHLTPDSCHYRLERPDWRLACRYRRGHGLTLRSETGSQPPAPAGSGPDRVVRTAGPPGQPRPEGTYLSGSGGPSPSGVPVAALAPAGPSASCG